MAKKQFQAESKRLLDLMIHSIYTHKDIFLRELISNASDAIDKIYYKALTDEAIVFNKEDFYIRITADKTQRLLTIADTGIGMTKEELENNLGTIARSGSLDFKKDNEVKDGYDIIGQFGVGFYSAFMVADTVRVLSKALGSEDAWLWESDGAEGYTLEEAQKDTVGTTITLKIHQNTEEEDYDAFLEPWSLRNIIKKHSDFIRYPIKMDFPEQRLKEGTDDEYEDLFEEKIVNSMIPMWKKNRTELTQEDYDHFYSEKHYGWDKPLRHIHISADGAVRYNAVLYIPEKTPFDFYTKEYEKGLELYSRSVLIMNKCKDLIPDYFSFVKGMVDSEDLSLNISREMLQHDRQLRLIAKRIQDKVKSELENLLTDDREKYQRFFDNFGRHLKYGVYTDFGAHKEVLQDLLLFHSSQMEKPVTLKEYISRMKDDQKYIYYAAGESTERLSKMPQIDLLADKGYEILFFTDEVDEFAIKVLHQYDEKEFKNVAGGDLGLEEESTTKSQEITAENQDLFAAMKAILGDQVAAVRASKILKTHPVCLTTQGEVSIEMEKVLQAMPGSEGIKADKVLELNTQHPVFASLQKAWKDASDCGAFAKIKEAGPDHGLLGETNEVGSDHEPSDKTRESSPKHEKSDKPQEINPAPSAEKSSSAAKEDRSEHAAKSPLDSGEPSTEESQETKMPPTDKTPSSVLSPEAQKAKDHFVLYTTLLLNQALLMEGLSVKDPLAFSQQICQLMLLSI